MVRMSGSAATPLHRKTRLVMFLHWSHVVVIISIAGNLVMSPNVSSCLAWDWAGRSPVCVYAKFVCEEGSVQAIAASIRMNGPISSLGISVSLVCRLWQFSWDCWPGMEEELPVMQKYSPEHPPFIRARTPPLDPPTLPLNSSTPKSCPDLGLSEEDTWPYWLQAWACV